MGDKLRFRILMTILPITVVLLVSSSLYHYNVMKQNLMDHYDETRQNVEAHIVDIINLIDSGYRMLEIRLESDLQEKAEFFLESYEEANGDLDKVDLNKLKEEQGMFYDFMVIDPETIIIKSTIKEALQFNFTTFDPDLGVKINAIRNGDEIWFEQVRTNVGTGKLSKFAYIPTGDHKYLLEVAYSVDGFDAVTEELKPNSIIKRMTEISPAIIGINMFDAYGYQIVDSGVNYEPTPESLEIVKKAKLDRQYGEKDSNNIYKKYLYIDLNQHRERTMANTDRVIEILYDEQILENQLNELWQTTVFGILIVLLFLTISILYFSKQLTKPIEALKEVALQIADGNYDVKVETDANDEVGELAKTFNLMVQEVNNSFIKIENQNAILENYNKNLEDMVDQRTNELKERNDELESKNHELEIAWIKANEATESKSSFLAMISHEIRTPINGIIGMAYLMLRTKLNAKQNDYTHKIRSSAENLLEIINDVLDISKLEAGKVNLEKIPFSIEEVFELISNQLGYKCSEKGLELIFKNDINLPEIIIGDALRIRQILLNLINNAIKFTEKGEIIVSTRIIEDGSDQVKIEFSIEDTGIGIDSGKLSKLFTPFQQADDSISRKYGGTGLGLSICKHFVDLMAGEIWVESELNKGSKFYFTAIFDLDHKEGHTLKHDVVNLQNLNILLVDDSDTTRDVLCDMLSEYSSEVHMAASGEDALQMIEASKKRIHEYDLILMDWKMPGKDGIETASEIKSMMHMSKVPAILMLTGYDLDEVRKNDKSVHIDAFLSKPVIKSALIQTISQLINTNRFRPEALEKNITKVLDTEEDIYILLAEDNLINQQIVRELLEHPLFHVDVVGNGVAAINAITQYDYDLVLMDIQMPDLDGLEATRRIRNTFSKEVLPIIAMTAHAMEEDRLKCFEAGMNDYMSKPIVEEVFFNMMAKWIDKKMTIKEIEGELSFEHNEISSKLMNFQTKAPIAALRGNWKLYIKLLRDFYRKYGDLELSLTGLIEEGDYVSAKNLIHSIRGISGNLGAMDLFIVSQTLETDLNKGNLSKTNNSLKAFLEEFKRVISDIALIKEESDDYLIHEESIHSKASMGLDLLIKDIKTLLKNGSSETEEYIPALRNLASNTEWAALGEELIDQIENYDFDEALKTINILEVEVNR